MDEIDAMKAISDNLEKLSGEERARVIAWALAKYGAEGFHGGFQQPPTNRHQSAPVEKPAAKSEASRPKNSKASRKVKSIISMDKTLNLSPSGKLSASQFAAEKAPSNVMHKAVVAVYYLRETIGLQKITVSAVYTFFKSLSWPLPADLRNALQKAGSEGWLDTFDGEDIKLTSMGENLIEHELPAKKG